MFILMIPRMLKPSQRYRLSIIDKIISQAIPQNALDSGILAGINIQALKEGNDILNHC